MLKVDYEHCTGCGACVQHCPKQCITWKAGEFGFQYPIIDEKTCIDCHLCEKVCPIDKELRIPEDQKVYAVVNSDKETLLHSTSGGAFSAIAETVLSEGGVVYGCSMEGGFQVKHIRITDAKALTKLRGSKYVQSDTGDTFSQAEKDLKAGLKVLYSGTPCQIAGLQNFLGKEYDNLLTVDIVCHGVGSQAYFDKFLDYFKEKESGLTELRFRDKKFVGWSIGGVIANNKGSEKPFYNYSNYYYAYFLDGDIYRKSCYTCPYANIMRQGDLTLGDFWGIEKENQKINSDNGCSLVIANSYRGIELLKRLENKADLIDMSLGNATQQNAQLKRPSQLKVTRSIRVSEYENLSGREIQRMYGKNNQKRIVKGKIKFMIPNKLRRSLRGKI